jgi:hypothetical protein
MPIFLALPYFMIKAKSIFCAPMEKLKICVSVHQEFIGLQFKHFALRFAASQAII